MSVFAFQFTHSIRTLRALYWIIGRMYKNVNVIFLPTEHQGVQMSKELKCPCILCQDRRIVHDELFIAVERREAKLSSLTVSVYPLSWIDVKKIGHDPGAKGINLFGNELKRSQLADDTNFFCVDLISVEKAFNSVNDFGRIAGRLSLWVRPISNHNTTETREWR